MGKKSLARARTLAFLLLASCGLLSVILLVVFPPAVKPPPAALAPDPAASPAAVSPAPERAEEQVETAAPAETAPAADVQAPQEKSVRTAPAARPAAGPQKPERTGRIAVVIDDAGYSLPDLEPFLRFRGRLTVAVIPALPQSTEAARRVKAAGKELLIHVPMEPTNGEDPGPLFLKTGREAEVEPLMRRFADSVPGAVGINNHMGSKATADGALMDVLMRWMKREGGIFLDSRTTAQTAAAAAARAHQVPYLDRDVFLDVGTSREEILAAFRDGLAKARSRGSVIMIGHVQNPGVLAILESMTDEAARQGVEFSGLTDLAAADRSR